MEDACTKGTDVTGSRSFRVRLAAALLGAALLVAPTFVHAQGVYVALTTDSQIVDPGTVFDVSLTITQEGLPFNGFDAVIAYDPAALTLLPLSPASLQQGELMTNACATTFHLFHQGADTDTMTDVLLCNGVSVTGPGRIYRLRFRASDTPQVTHIQFLDGLQFYDEGLYVNPVYATDLDIGIGTGLVGTGPTPAPGKLDLRVTPNPAAGGGTSLTIETDRAGAQELSVFDLKGRLVRRFEDDTTAGMRTVHWDGRDALARAVPPGVYLVDLRMKGRSVTRRVSIVR
jgi:hypothetical protein